MEPGAKPRFEAVREAGPKPADGTQCRSSFGPGLTVIEDIGRSGSSSAT